MEKKEAKKGRCFSLTVYSRKSIESVLQTRRELISHYAYIKHDSDKITKEDIEEGSEQKEGDIKKLHFHVILKTIRPYSAKTVRGWFRNENNDIDGLCQLCNTPLAMYEYLTHKNNPEKYQYSESNIICDDKEHFSKDYDNDKLQSAVLELLEGAYLTDMIRKYGRDFIIHYKSIKAIIEDIRNQGTI